MATLEKIRSKGVLLIVVIGVALVSFIIGDFLTQGSTFFGKSREVVAEIDGESINIFEYQDLLDQITIFQKYETGQNDIDVQTMQQLRTYVWDQLIREKVLTAEAEEMGLTVSKEELSDRLIGDNIHPMIQQRRFFADESGRFSRALLLQFLNFKDEEPTDAQMYQMMDEYKKLWIFLEKTVKYSILQEKYNTLISSAIKINSLEAKNYFELNIPVYQTNYIVQPYYAVPDTGVHVTEKEITNRYKDQINQYKQDPNASIKFVSIAIEPQEDDFKEAESFIDELSNEFSTTDDVIELVNSNSDTPYTGRNYTKRNVPASLKDFAFKGKKGDVIGPLFENNTYTMARIMETGIMLPDSVRLRHIFLLKSDEAKTDSIVRAIQRGGNFGELARKYSAVKQTAENDGEIGWIQDGDEALDKEIMDNALNKRVNEVFTFNNPQGTQIIQIMEKTAPKPKVKLAILDREVVPSSKTESKLYNEAKRFAAELKAVDFDSIANQRNYSIRQAGDITRATEQILNIPESRQIVRWVFENSKGEVSDVFECANELVVACITDMNTSEYRSLGNVYAQIRNELIREKKAKLLIEQMNEVLKTNPSLNAIADKFNLELKEAENITFSSYQYGSEGYEPAVLGKTLSLNTNEISTPIQGNAGVFVVQAINIEKSDVSFDLETEKQKLASRQIYAMPNSIMMDMVDNAEIEDNRLNFY